MQWSDKAVISDSITYQRILPVPVVQSVDTIGRVGIPPGKPNINYDSLNSCSLYRFGRLFAPAVSW